MDTPTPAPLKSGFLSSEFILHLLPTIAGLVIAILPQNSKWVTLLGGVMAIYSSGHYSYLRTNLKTLAIQAGLAAFKVFTDAAAANGDTIPGTATVLPPIPISTPPAQVVQQAASFQPAPPATPSPASPVKQ